MTDALEHTIDAHALVETLGVATRLALLALILVNCAVIAELALVSQLFRHCPPKDITNYGLHILLQYFALRLVILYTSSEIICGNVTLGNCYMRRWYMFQMPSCLYLCVGTKVVSQSYR